MPLIPVAPSEAPLSLEELARRIRKSSNFRFEWRWFRRTGASGVSAEAARQVLDDLVADPESHRFLRESFDPMYDSSFEIRPIHEHCLVEPRSEEFVDILARAAADRLGAYSRHLAEASRWQRRRVHALFGKLGEYAAFELLPGSAAGCDTCASTGSHLFTNWFYDVVWDWCFVVLWEGSDLAWVGLLTDTD